MKPFLSVGAVAGVLFSSALYAGGYERHHHPRHVKAVYPHHHAGNWVIPLVVGGVLGYALNEPRRETVSYVQSVPSPVPYAPLYEERWVYFGDCGCERKVLVKIR